MNSVSSPFIYIDDFNFNYNIINHRKIVSVAFEMILTLLNCSSLVITSSKEPLCILRKPSFTTAGYNPSFGSCLALKAAVCYIRVSSPFIYIDDFNFNYNIINHRQLGRYII
jgi:hypothetical protein